MQTLKKICVLSSRRRMSEEFVYVFDVFKNEITNRKRRAKKMNETLNKFSTFLTAKCSTPLDFNCNYCNILQYFRLFQKDVQRSYVFRDHSYKIFVLVTRIISPGLSKVNIMLRQ